MKLELGQTNQKNRVTASELFNSVQTMYKAWDYRCLVAYSHKDPTKWKTYDMHDYRKASSKEELKKVDRFKYDNNFHNWEDPKVLKYFANSTKSSKRAWKKTYGFPYTTTIPWNSKHFMSFTMKCWKKCASLEESSYYNKILCLRIQFFQEQSTFAKDCRKNGGLFKCCVQAFTLHTFETSRNRLIKEGLIKDRPTNWCSEKEGPCMICNADAMCTKRNNNTGEITNTYLKEYKKEHRVIRWHFNFIIFLYRLGGRIKPLTHVLASDFHGAKSLTCAYLGLVLSTIQRR